MEKVVALTKRRGFIYPSSEIYGGLSGFYDYGPYGVALKRAIRDQWWRHMVELRDDVVGLESTLIMPEAVWDAWANARSGGAPTWCSARNARSAAGRWTTRGCST
jgi:glycyl-tRNA synthetase (class II)